MPIRSLGHHLLLRTHLLAGLLFTGCGFVCITGCDQDEQPSGGVKVRTSAKLFGIGDASRYAEDNVYTDFYQSHGVYLVNNRGMLVALAAEAPATGSAVQYDRYVDQYRDPRDGSRYTADGLPTGQPTGREALERCRIALSIQIDGKPRQLVVDPSYRFRHEDNQWSNFNSFHDLRPPPEEETN